MPHKTIVHRKIILIYDIRDRQLTHFYQVRNLNKEFV